MKKILYTFKIFVSEITKDFMLFACLIGPIFMAVLFRFGLPVLENFLCNYFYKEEILTSYYILFDLLLGIMTPILFCFSGVLVILEEIDCGTAKYFSVTPIGKSGYVISRIGIPSFFALLYNALLLSIFTSAKINGIMILLLSVNGTLIALVTSIFVVTFAKNKIEGMALVKMCGLLILGIPSAFFIKSPVRYCFAVLPSFWMAELCITNDFLFFILGILSSLIIIFGLYGKFKKKLL